MAPSADQTPATALKQHMVYFYESEIALLSALTVFIGDGLREGDVCIVLSTREHHESLLEQLKRNGLNVPAAHTQDAYIWMDAAEILSQFMVAGMPEPELFTAVVGSPIAQAIQRQRHVRVFGEMVTVLWSQGNHAAAMRLEEFGNELSAQFQDTSFFCAYPMHFLRGISSAGIS